MQQIALKKFYGWQFHDPNLLLITITDVFLSGSATKVHLPIFKGRHLETLRQRLGSRPEVIFINKNGRLLLEPACGMQAATKEQSFTYQRRRPELTPCYRILHNVQRKSGTNCGVVTTFCNISCDRSRVFKARIIRGLVTATAGDDLRGNASNIRTFG